MKKKKYKGGTGTKGVVNNYMQSPSEVIAENNIDLAQAKYEAETNPLNIALETLGQMGMQYGMNNGGLDNASDVFKSTEEEKFAYGTKKGGSNSNVEDNEIVETPDGQNFKMKGKSHAEGGIDLDLPDGTKVYSDRIEIDNKSMADRQEEREKKLAKLEKLMSKTTDNALRNSHERTTETVEAEEQHDLEVQDYVNKAMEKESKAKLKKEQFAFGTGLAGVLSKLINKQQPRFPTNLTGTSEDFHDKNTHKGGFGVLEEKGNSGDSIPSAVTEVGMEQSDVGMLPSEDNDSGMEIPGLTGGDVTGIAGNIISGVGPLLTTMKSRATDTPNENYYEGFGKDGLESLDKSKGYVEEQKDEALDSINRRAGASKRSGRIGARGINTQRASDLAVDQNANDATAKLYDNVSKSMMQLFGQEAQMENKQDQVVMRGEEQTDMRNRQDKDNHYSNIAQNLVGLGEGVQQTGKDLNQTKQNEIIMKMLNQLHEYGVGFDKNYEKTNQE